jgi:hypothetical protein
MTELFIAESATVVLEMPKLNNRDGSSRDIKRNYTVKNAAIKANIPNSLTYTI